MKIMTIAELKKNFMVTGRFYTIEYDTGRTEECLSMLEIRRINNLTASNDGVIVVMNPGKSKPVDASYKIRNLKARNFESRQVLAIPLVPIKPDNTEYEIMKIMETNGLNCMKMIHLSDLREPKCELFYPKIESLGLSDKDNIHSIFSKERKEELEDVFSPSTNLMVILSWGVNNKLKNLITLATESDKLKNNIGYPKNMKPENKFYYHPTVRLSKKETSWLDQINSQIKKWQTTAFFKQSKFRIKRDPNLALK